MRWTSHLLPMGFASRAYVLERSRQARPHHLGNAERSGKRLAAVAAHPAASSRYSAALDGAKLQDFVLQPAVIRRHRVDRAQQPLGPGVELLPEEKRNIEWRSLARPHAEQATFSTRSASASAADSVLATSLTRAGGKSFGAISRSSHGPTARSVRAGCSWPPPCRRSTRPGLGRGCSRGAGAIDRRRAPS